MHVHVSHPSEREGIDAGIIPLEPFLLEIKAQKQLSEEVCGSIILNPIHRLNISNRDVWRTRTMNAQLAQV